MPLHQEILSALHFLYLRHTSPGQMITSDYNQKDYNNEILVQVGNVLHVHAVLVQGQKFIQNLSQT